MLRRFLGIPSRPAAPAPSLDEAATRATERADELDQRIKRFDAELASYRDQLAKTRPGPGQDAIRQRAGQVLRHKKMFEAQRTQLLGQSFNLEQANFATHTMQDTIATVQSMKSASAAMKKQMRSMPLERVERVFDDMQDMLEDANEIQDLLGRSFSLGGADVDDADLDQELSALGEEIGVEGSSNPSWLAAMSSPPTTGPELLAETGELGRGQLETGEGVGVRV